GVAILVVGHSVPQVTPSSATNGPSAPGRVRALADPGDRLRASLSLPAPTAGMASVMVVSRAGEVILLVRATRTAADFRTSLAALR
ncbi:MAG TPA: hypothetical protein VFE14_07210, partial [Micromonosporaceae bacterium]|nr:hypothetical protein [Micromonosporaceae bacterium]